ncbi:alpha-hydroxy acid oxidase [Aestuariibius sp. 2305UL40-4]|uniref:alpha-hydroxy acid oxidase n=1 Tax=Aestuariibius violaceus TaxID=3234132 RepID=UPI00345ED402
MDFHSRYPSLADLRLQARRRLPRFVWDYLDSATGTEATARTNRAALDQVRFTPSILHGEISPDLSIELLGQSYPLPFGFAPVGMSGLIWPGAERYLAQTAADARIPYTLSTVASLAPEDLKGDIGPHAWFQLYPPRDPEILSDLLGRARATGFKTLVLTVDVPAPSQRERQTRGGLTNPPQLTPRILWQIMRRPAWAIAVLRNGLPRMRTLDPYTTSNRAALPSNAHAGYLLRTSPDWDYLARLRDAWTGPLIVKGVLNEEDAPRLERAGVDAIWISNHAGRQFDAAPATIEVLPAIRANTRLPLLLDGGLSSGLDILRAFSLGADFTMLGRAPHDAVAALGPAGPAHLVEILTRDLTANMHQLGVRSYAELSARLL